MSQVNDLSRSLTAFDQDSTLIAVIEISLKSWLVAGVVPGVSRAPLKELEADEDGVLRLLYRWREEATKAGRRINRVVVAFEAGRDGFWLARWLRARGIETYVIHAASVAGLREHWWAKTDRLDTDAEACLSRMAAGGGGALSDGGDSDAGRRGCAASEP
jgi:transposase